MSTDKSKTCGNCRYFDEADQYCRANPPMVLLVRMTQPPTGQLPTAEFATVWPVVSEDETCGRHISRRDTPAKR